MDETHVGGPAPGVSGEPRKTVVRPMTQMPAGPDYWPVASQPTGVHRRVAKLATTRELAQEPAS